MANTPPPASTPKDGLHPRNRHRGRYDFARLVAAVPALAGFVQTSPHGGETINFADANAVKMLNQALLLTYYGVRHWDIPAGYLTPPVPGRADYIHYVADLLAEHHAPGIPRGRNVRVLDVGVGANCIYPILGHHEYGWKFVGTEVDNVAVRVARQVVAANPGLSGAVEIRQQTDAQQLLAGVVKAAEYFDLVLCNPPFHASPAEAEAANRRKEHHLGTARPHGTPNFGGQARELWYPGGENTFLWRLAQESAHLRQQVYWFTTLVSKKETLPGLYKTLQKLGAAQVRTLPMQQGHKVSRVVAWTFLDEEQQQAWRTKHWQHVQ